MKRFIQFAFLLILISRYSMAQPSNDDVTSRVNDGSRPDSNQTHKAQKKSWKLLQIQMGLAYGGRSNAGFGQPNPGLILSMETCTFAFGFKELHGAGIGFSVFEFMFSSSLDAENKTGNWSSDGTPTSLFPVYLYYPLFSKERKAGKWQVHSPFGYVFAGGSGWGFPNNYLHIGVSTILTTWNVTRTRNALTPPPQDIFAAVTDLIFRAYPTMNVGLQAGFFYSGRYNVEADVPYTGGFGQPQTLALPVDNNYGFYISLRFGMGAVFIK